MKRIGLLVLFPMIVFRGLSGQTGLYFNVSALYPIIPKLELHEEASLSYPLPGVVDYTLTESYELRPGVSVHAGFKKSLIKRVSLDAGVGFSCFRFNRNLTISAEDEGEPVINGATGYPIGTFYGEPGDIRFQDVDIDDPDSIVLANPDIGETSILYLCIPIMVHFSLIQNRLEAGLGITNYLIAGSSQIKNVLTGNSIPPVFEEYNDRSSDGLSNYQLDIQVQLKYMLFKGLWLTAAYGHSLRPFYDEGMRRAGDVKYRTLLLGLRYYI